MHEALWEDVQTLLRRQQVLDDKLENIINLLKGLITMSGAMNDTVQNEIANLTAAVAQESTVNQSAIVLINGFAGQLAAAVAAAQAAGASANQLAALNSLAGNITANATALASAVSASTNATQDPPQPTQSANPAVVANGGLTANTSAGVGTSGVLSPSVPASGVPASGVAVSGAPNYTSGQALPGSGAAVSGIPLGTPAPVSGYAGQASGMGTTNTLQGTGAGGFPASGLGASQVAASGAGGSGYTTL